jgi:glutaredoxin 3
MAHPIVYSTGLCPYCFLAKRLLDRRGVAYEERRMRRSQRARLAPLGGGLTFPQIVFGERVVDGWTELRRLDRAGELASLVQAMTSWPSQPSSV